jgi:hypothetical protein
VSAFYTGFFWDQGLKGQIQKCYFLWSAFYYSVRRDSAGFVRIAFQSLKLTGITAINKAIKDDIRIISNPKEIRYAKFVSH